ncbi:MAG: zinc ribbon domain-containing protein [Lachnospiraceae bacterium]|nr:zinc ribbon domain-containing protein [Lachnospiraceae bacterium]
MGQADCYSIITKRFGICSSHREWFQRTQDLYNEILEFYYQLYLDELAGQSLNSQEALRALEKLTIAGRDKQSPAYPLPWEKIPLYFRRAAINAAIAAAKSFLSRDWQQQRSGQFSEAVTFYKGMYRDLSEQEVTLKVWTGEEWRWHRCRLTGNAFPEECRPMSPSVVLKGKRAELHLPVKKPVEDGRTAKLRMAAEEKICTAVFTNTDTAVICCILNAAGQPEHSLFLRGGGQYVHQCRQVLEKLKRSQTASGDDGNPKANQKYWMKLKHLNEYYSHKFSRQVIDFCTQQKAKVLVLPDFDKQYTKLIMSSVGNWSPLHLSTQIRQKLKYKAWDAGIVILEENQYQAASLCSRCGAKVRRQGKEYICENGHSGNAYLNTAQNLGKKCLESFRKQNASKAESTAGETYPSGGEIRE